MQTINRAGKWEKTQIKNACERVASEQGLTVASIDAPRGWVYSATFKGADGAVVPGLIVADDSSENFDVAFSHDQMVLGGENVDENWWWNVAGCGWR